MTNQHFSPDSFQTFGELLKYLRRREHLTQLEFSIMVGYSDAQITRLEKNLQRPDLTALKALFIPALGIENDPNLVARFLELAQSARQEDAPSPGVAPYKGLLFFDESDSELFFGREALDDRIRQWYSFVRKNRNSMSPSGKPPADRLFNAGVYFWGALGLHALRLEVGDDKFFDRWLYSEDLAPIPELGLEAK